MCSPASGQRELAYATEVQPTGHVTCWPLSSKLWLPARSPLTPHATEVSLSLTSGNSLPPCLMVEAFPRSFILGAKPSHSAPSLENSKAGGGRDERICAWLRPNTPRTRSVCGPPNGLNYFCSIGGQIPKIPGNGAHVPWVGWMTSLGNKRAGRALGCTGSLNHRSLVPTLPGSREMSSS